MSFGVSLEIWPAQAHRRTPTILQAIAGPTPLTAADVCAVLAGGVECASSCNSPHGSTSFVVGCHPRQRRPAGPRVGRSGRGADRRRTAARVATRHTRHPHHQHRAR